jgi:hypothetical protein
MKIIEITYSEGKTYQEKQFEPRNIHISLKMEVDSDVESVEKVYELSKSLVRKELEKALPKQPVDITKSEDIPF